MEAIKRNYGRSFGCTERFVSYLWGKMGVKTCYNYTGGSFEQQFNLSLERGSEF
jgi:hypothetical protein